MSKLNINLKLPDWASEKSMIFIVGGNEVLARYKFKDIGWEVKTGRCSNCGQCCFGSKDNPEWFAYDSEKGCKFLELEPGQTDKYICTNRDEPWHCVRGSGGGKGKCTIRFEKVE